MKKISLFVLSIICFVSCKSTKVESVQDSLNKKTTEITTDNQPDNNVLVIEKPVYVPENDGTDSYKRPTSQSAYETVTLSYNSAVKKPSEYKNGTFYYTYNENFVYEVYAQPLHLTDIILEPGEIVKSKPLLSEDESIWELTAGVAVDQETLQDVQHLFIKPAYKDLDSTLIIITNRRVYHFRLRSFNSTHMAMVKFLYPGQSNEWVTPKDNKEGTPEFIRKTSSPEFLSFDYTIKTSRKKPEFTPKIVYDDGQSTYIQVDEIVLQKSLPVLFNEKNEIINYTVKGNVFIIPRLINKCTLRLDKKKVEIEKEIKKPKKEQKDE